MTIAMCYLSPEGVVLGADSTASVHLPGGGFHYFNHAQKLFEIGEHSTLALTVWGMGALPLSSHRTLVAKLADDLQANPVATVAAVAERWIEVFWAAYNAELGALLPRIKALNKKSPFDPSKKRTSKKRRTEAEETEFRTLDLGLRVGFCVGGFVPPDRTPGAFVMGFEPLNGKPTPSPLAFHQAGFWGAPAMIQRLIFGVEPQLKADILASAHWTGTAADLEALFAKHRIQHLALPIRDAIDYVHAYIFSTIKAFKFSQMSQICGGPIELAVIRTDRRFEWVRHKKWDAALNEGAIP